MARRGENIRKRSDGRWEGRYLIHINGSKKYRSVYAPSYNEVKQKLFNSKKESEITLLFHASKISDSYRPIVPAMGMISKISLYK